MKKNIWRILAIVAVILIFNMNNVYSVQKNEDLTGHLSNDLEGYYIDTLKEKTQKIAKQYWEYNDFLAVIKVDVKRNDDNTYLIGSGKNFVTYTGSSEFIGGEDKKDIDTWEVWIEIKYIATGDVNERNDEDGNTIVEEKYFVSYQTCTYDEPDYNPETDAWKGTVELDELTGKLISPLVNAIKGASDVINKAEATAKFIADLTADPGGTLGNILFDGVRWIADGIQMIANLAQTVPEGTVGDITYSYYELKNGNTESNKARNEYTNVGKYVKAKSKSSWQKAAIPEKKIEDDDGVEIEQFTPDTEIPVIQVDIYNMASGNIGILDVNFLVPNDKIHTKKSAWYKIRNIAVTIIHITFYFAAACLITSLIWHGFNLVKGSLTPDSRKRHAEGLHRFAVSLIMLIGTVVIMAIGVYANEMFLPKINDENTSEKELPIRVNVQEAGYSFSTNPTGYIRYVAGIENHELCGKKILYTSTYLVLAIINLIVMIIMIARTIGMWLLGVLGPIIVALHVLNVDDKFKIKYQDWAKWYLTLAMVQVVLALISYITLKVVIIPK